MFKGFRDFLMRGNVVDLAVAVVIGTAFSQVVNAIAKDLLGSVLGELVGDKTNFNDVTWGFVNVGSTITAMINFLIIAAAVYFMVVMPMNRLAALRRGRHQDDTPTVAEDIALLTEIRDLLAARRGDI